MKYITLNELSETIRKNIWKIPRDIDCVIGVPRSGMIAASIISSYLNVPLIDVDSFISGIKPYGGQRLCYFMNKHIQTNKALVIDDTVKAGKAMNEVKRKLEIVSGITFTYMCVYLEGKGKDVIDFYLKDVRRFTDNYTNIVLYEWNIFQHNERFMQKCLYDLDGVLCLDPPDERKKDEYLAYIEDATPLFIPRTKLGGIITYRLSVNREITEKWLQRNGITYNELIMFEASSWDVRNESGFNPAIYKGLFYKKRENYELFVESSQIQAIVIAKISCKPVFCVETNMIYQQ